jgi:ParB family chromosome partitioning protein
LTAAIAQVPILKEVPPLDHNSASQNIPVGLIVRSPFNREATVDDDFVDDIRINGVIHPVIVRTITASISIINQLPQHASVKIGGTAFELVAGERRWLASRRAGKSPIHRDSSSSGSGRARMNRSR